MKIEDNSFTVINVDSKRLSEKNFWVTFLLAVFFGYLGFHRFYVGKIGTGILWILTVGLGGIGALVDILKIALGEFKDSDGEKIKLKQT
jgi:TM2 domain-containing membrane protein YozV